MRRITVSKLGEILKELDGKGFGAYKRLKAFIVVYKGCSIKFTKIQSDPHAIPSIMEVLIPANIHKIPKEILRYEVPLSDYMARILYRLCKSYARKCGSGYSCYVGVPRPSPRILLRSCSEIIDSNIILRLYVGLPAKGRKILGEQATKLLTRTIPKIIDGVIEACSRLDKIKCHVENYIDQEYIRSWLYEKGYVCFIGDGSILPRESSISEKPLKNAVPFTSPESLRVSIRLPSGRIVSGMAIPKGLTIITGGGYHGKTTILQAIQDGIYDHVKGDGRELAISMKYTVLVRAEDGRIVSCVDIKSFIDNLPSGEDTSNFTTLNASGSTSMAASINEAVEAGAEVILIDEDTSATNLLYKDNLMNQIIRSEPIKPLCLQARSLIEKTGVSIILVSSASSAFLQQADKIILIDHYKPYDITDQVKNVINAQAKPIEYAMPKKRVFIGIPGLSKVKARGMKIAIKYTDSEAFEVDLTYYPRIVEKGQVKFIAYILRRLARNRKPMSVKDVISYVNKLTTEKGFAAFADPVPPDLTMVDGFDVVWVLNRLYKALFKQL